MNTRVQHRILSAVWILFLMVLVMCDGTVNDGNTQKKSVTYEFTFPTTTDGWFRGFADYPPGRTSDNYYELGFFYAQVPVFPSERKFGLYITGNNHNSDLFMFIKRMFDNLKPDTAYGVVFHLEIASNASVDDTGSGSGSSVWLKAGASVVEPAAIDEGDYYRMNIDKGNQAAGGADAIVLGTIGVPGNNSDTSYRLKTLQNSTPFTVTTDETGNLWAIIGTDSGFEGTTSLYYSVIKITFTEL